MSEISEKQKAEQEKDPKKRKEVERILEMKAKKLKDAQFGIAKQVDGVFKTFTGEFRFHLGEVSFELVGNKSD